MLYNLGVAITWHGWALSQQGKEEAGLQKICEGLSTYQEPGTVLGLPLFFSCQAEVLSKRKEYEEGLSVVAKAQQLVEQTGEHVFEAELYRLKGELLLQQSPDSYRDAETSFQKALEVSRRQEFKSIELRVATSLARLWQSQGKTTEARDKSTPKRAYPTGAQWDAGLCEAGEASSAWPGWPVRSEEGERGPYLSRRGIRPIGLVKNENKSKIQESPDHPPISLDVECGESV